MSSTRRYIDIDINIEIDIDISLGYASQVEDIKDTHTNGSGSWTPNTHMETWMDFWA